MNKDKALERLTALEAEAMKLRKIIEAFDNDAFWAPKDGDTFALLVRGGDYVIGKYDRSFKRDFDQGHIFPTTEAAIRERGRRALVQELKKRANFKPDWSDASEKKWYLRFDHVENIIFWDGSYTVQTSNPIYFREKDDSLIEEYGDRLKLLFEGFE